MARQKEATAAKKAKNRLWKTRTASPMQALNEQLAVTVEDAAALLQLGRQPPTTELTRVKSRTFASAIKSACRPRRCAR